MNELNEDILDEISRNPVHRKKYQQSDYRYLFQDEDLEDYGFPGVEIFGFFTEPEDLQRIFSIMDRYEVDQDSETIGLRIHLLPEFDYEDVMNKTSMSDFGDMAGFYIDSSESMDIAKGDHEPILAVNMDSDRAYRTFEEEICHHKVDAHGWAEDIHRAISLTQYDEWVANGFNAYSAIIRSAMNGINDIAAFQIAENYGRDDLVYEQVREDLRRIESDNLNERSMNRIESLQNLFFVYSKSLPATMEDEEIREWQNQIAGELNVSDQDVVRVKQIFADIEFPESEEKLAERMIEAQNIAVNKLN